MAEATALRNNALPYPVYGAPFTVVFPMLDADGDLVTGATTPDSEISKNGDTFADCTNEATEIATSSGMYYLTLTGTELTTDVAAIISKSATSGMKTTPLVLYPRKLVTLASGTSQGGDTGYITLAAGTVTYDDQFNGCLCVAVIDSVTEARVLQDCTASNQQCTVTPAWNTAPDANDTYTIYLPEGIQVPTANTIRVSGTAQTARDIGASVLLSSGTGTGQISLSSGLLAWNPAWDAEVESEVDDSIGGGTGTALTAIPWNAAWDAEVQSEVNDEMVNLNLDHLLKTATAGVDMTTEVTDGSVISRIISNSDTSLFVPSASNLTTVAADVAATHVHAGAAATDTTEILTRLPDATPGAAGGVFIAGSNAATSVTTALTANITGNLSGSVGSVTGAVGSVTGAVGSVTGAVGSVTGAVGSVTGAVGSVAANGITATSIAADAINAAAVKADAVTKIQNGLATPTNITAGTITTVTNLTNAPTNGDLTATMKASVKTEVGNALNTAIPGSPTADSINQRVAAIDDLTQASGSGDLAFVKTAIGTPTDLGNGVATLAGNLTDIDGEVDVIEGYVSNIANVGSPSYEAPSSYTLTTGNQTSGTYANVDSDNDVYHVLTDAAGTLSLIYDWTLQADEQANSIIWRGRWNGNNDTLLFEMYDWVAPGWVTWFTQVGVVGTTAAADIAKETSLVGKYTGTGTNAGKLRCRITGSGLSSCTLSTDQLIVGKTTRSGGIANGSTVTLAATTNNANYSGNNWILDLGGQDISGCYFYGAKQVTGIASGTTGVTFENCDFGAATVPPGKYINCGFGLASGTLTAASEGEYILRSCYSCVPGSGTPAFDWATGSGTIRVNGRGWHGGSSHTIDGDNTVSWEVNGGGGQTFAGGGTVELRGNFRQVTFTGHAAGKTSQIASSGCGPIAINGTGGTVNVFGLTGTITDNSGGAVTITSTQVVNLANVNAQMDDALNTAIPGSPTADSVNERVATMDTSVALMRLLIATGTVVDDNDPDPTATAFETNLAEASNDHYNGAFCVFYSGALLGQSRKISDYDGTTKIITTSAFTEAPAGGDTFAILGRSE